MKKVLVLLCLLLTVGAAATYFAGFTDVQKIKAFFVAEKTADSPVAASAPYQPASIGTEKRVALVIGNSDYAAADDLPNDVNDANDMAEVLRGYGFKIVGDKALTDVDLTGMLKALEEFGQQLQQGGVGLFYYSGHGLEVDGQQYIVPVDAQVSSKTELPYRMVNINTILEKVGESKSQLNLVILDACRNNPFTKALGIKAVGYNGFSKIEKNIPNGTLIASATAMGDTASSACEHNSCYTTQLLKFLREKPTDEVRLLLGDVTEAVIAATNNEQTPWTSGSMMGRFYFAQNSIPSNITPTVAAAEIPAKVEKPLQDENTPTDDFEFIGALDGTYINNDSDRFETQFSKSNQEFSLTTFNCSLIGKLKQNKDYWEIIATGQDGMCKMIDKENLGKPIGKLYPEAGARANSGKVLKFLINFSKASLVPLSGNYAVEGY